MWECSTNKGSAAALPRPISAGCPTVVHCTSAVGHKVLAFMTVLLEAKAVALHPERYQSLSSKLSTKREGKAGKKKRR
jgi:hypothetical protein